MTDITLGKENQKHFQQYLNGNPAISPGIDLTVTVLTTGFWPSYKSSDLCLPAEMVGFESQCFSFSNDFFFNSGPLIFLFRSSALKFLKNSTRQKPNIGN